MHLIHVTAAIIREGNRILICQRGAGGSCAYLWEFPGGKIEPGESPEECLIRECREELGVDIAIRSQYDDVTYDYPERSIRLTFFNVEIISGSIDPRVHLEMRWINAHEFEGFNFCPADVGIARKLAQEA